MFWLSGVATIWRLLVMPNKGWRTIAALTAFLKLNESWQRFEVRHTELNSFQIIIKESYLRFHKIYVTLCFWKRKSLIRIWHENLRNSYSKHLFEEYSLLCASRTWLNNGLDSSSHLTFLVSLELLFRNLVKRTRRIFKRNNKLTWKRIKSSSFAVLFYTDEETSKLQKSVRVHTEKMTKNDGGFLFSNQDR